MNEQCMKACEQAMAWLKLAIARHERHLSGAEATSRESQMQMMTEMRNAMAWLESMQSMGSMGK